MTCPGILNLYVEREDCEDGSITYHLWDNAGHWIVGLNDDPAEVGGDARMYADTITRAVNCHDELLALLVEIDKRVIFDGASGFDREFSERVEAVLAKATA